MPDFTIPAKPWVALLFGSLNTGLVFVVGATDGASGLPPVVLFYLACLLAVLGWVMLHIVPTRGDAPAANDGSPRGPVGPASSPLKGETIPLADQAAGLRVAAAVSVPEPATPVGGTPSPS